MPSFVDNFLRTLLTNVLSQCMLVTERVKCVNIINFVSFWEGRRVIDLKIYLLCLVWDFRPCWTERFPSSLQCPTFLTHESSTWLPRPKRAKWKAPRLR